MKKLKNLFMTFVEAAVEALKIVDNEPKNPKQLWNIIEKNDLKTSNGKTPWASLRVMLVSASDKSYDSFPDKDEVIFECHEEKTPDEFKLIDYNSDEESQNIKEIQSEKADDNDGVSEIVQVTSDEVDWRKIIVKNNNGNLEYNLKECDEYTYIILKEHGDKVKIGKTGQKTPEKRLRGMNTYSPDMKLKIAFPASRYSENYLHSKFDDLKYKGEVFYRGKTLREFVEKEEELKNYILKRYELDDKIKDLDSKVLKLT